MLALRQIAHIPSWMPVRYVQEGGSPLDATFFNYGTNCHWDSKNLPLRITNLKIEIARGETIYTPEELKLLERKLKEDEDLMKWFLRSR